jgi:energy-coupling factor transport system permease protein
VTAAFSLYAARQSGLHRFHPLTKLALAAFGLAAGVVLPGLWANYLAFSVLLLPLAAWGQILRPYLRAVLRVALPFGISLFLIQGFLWPGGTPLFRLGPVSLKVEGLAFAVQSTGRILMVVGSFLLLALSTRPDALMIALAQRGVPNTLTYIVVATVQIAPRFQAKAAAILDAQRARGLETEGGFRRRARALLPLVMPLVLGSIVDIEERAIALEARAFSRHGPKTSLLVLADSRAQAVLRWLLLGGALLLIAARLVFWR